MAPDRQSRGPPLARHHERRLGGFHPRLEGFARCKLERHFRRIDIVIRPVVHNHLEIHHGESRQVALLGGFDNALLDGWTEVLRYRAAEYFVDPFETSAALERLKNTFAVAKLTASA